MRGRKNDGAWRHIRHWRCALPCKRCLVQTQETRYQAAPAPFARLHSEHPGLDIAPEKQLGSMSPKLAIVPLQR